MVEVRAGRALGNAEKQPDLAVPEPFHVVEKDDGALTRREPRERGAQPRAKIRRLARIAELRRQGVRQFIGIADFSPARNVQRRVGYYTVQPGPKRLVRPKAVQRTIGVQKSLLDRIFGIFVSRDDRSGNGVRTPLVRANQRPERRRISVLRGANERALIPPNGHHGLRNDNAL